MFFFRENEFDEMNAYFKQGNYAAVIERMSKWQLAYIALFQEKFPQHKSTLQLPEFAEFWQKKQEILPLSGHPNFQFQAQEGITNFDFVTGYIFYLLAIKSKKDKKADDYNNYLEQAMTHKSFHAAQLFLHDLQMNASDKNEASCKVLLEKLQQLDQYMIQLGSPGYLLLANGYLHVAIQAKTFIDNQDMSCNAFGFVWKYLNMALFDEERSAAAIHNAYFGVGLSRSNPFNLTTLNNMLDECRRLAGDALPLPSQKLIKTQSQFDYHKHQAAENSNVASSKE